MGEAGPESAVRFAPCDHVVQVYRDAGELADAVASYVAAGLAGGEPAILVATPAHVEAVAARLGARGWDAAALETDGMLVLADAEATLEAVLDDGAPAFRPFAAVVGGLIDRAVERSRSGRVRIFGEMVDVLCRRGDRAAADELEQLWNRLGARRRFSLFCGYRIDLFDREAQSTLLPQVYRAHSGVVAADGARLELAVDAALAEVLGGMGAQKVYANVGRSERAAAVPRAQLALAWVSAHMPRTAERVLEAARAHYVAAEPA